MREGLRLWAGEGGSGEGESWGGSMLVVPRYGLLGEHKHGGEGDRWNVAGRDSRHFECGPLQAEPPV